MLLGVARIANIIEVPTGESIPACLSTNAIEIRRSAASEERWIRVENSQLAAGTRGITAGLARCQPELLPAYVHTDKISKT